MKIFDSKSRLTWNTKTRQRFHEANQPRELTFSCFQNYPFLNAGRTRQWFVDALEDARTKHGFRVWAYVIMPDHVHLIVVPPTVASIKEPNARTTKKPIDPMARFLQKLKEPVARQAIAFMRMNAPRWLDKIVVQEGNRIRHRFWQPGGGYDRNITNASTLRSMIDYIHNNPVRKGLAELPEDWEWSSARWYAGLRPVKIEMDADILGTFQWD